MTKTKKNNAICEIKSHLQAPNSWNGVKKMAYQILVVIWEWGLAALWRIEAETSGSEQDICRQLLFDLKWSPSDGDRVEHVFGSDAEMFLVA